MQSRQLKLTHLVILLCLSVFAFSTNSTASQKDGLLRMYFLDVGQGDAIFIEAPNGNQILIDGGPDNKVIQELAKVMPFYDHDIDMVIATHPHADHIAGLIEVLERYNVKNVLQAKEDYNSPVVPAWRDAVKNEKTNEIEAIAGKIIELGNGVVLKIIYPEESLEGQTVKNPNNSSVVMMLDYKETEILLVGDIEAKVEKELLDDDIDADILKVGHHGSKTSTTANFLERISPQVAFVEVGSKNKFGHPSPEVIQRLENSGIKYYRTDLDGHMEVLTDGEIFRIKKY
ncbi:MAG: internalization-related competence protein ComEC/Rec2 protein [Candidatus Yanofskybacteria bacterium GW2011_GWA1_41_6]|uniref:Internalization-related competence protein ComEC/Rec2 protein n=1 Tax=Candidatus Yanofskybacteria bacterium GW2011_GWA1_41_6 TaxID=1619020 RepID=A0A0G0ZLJ6_9BACT|nr:MAG: internalization-related competence protein ComEC/Rec2 protein [Candidatus Yanofskybacteria bacterium GW2011_GWA1_41_6]